MINSGWTRGYGVIRCNPDTHDPEMFSTFAPKIVAMKGRNLEDTTLSRAIEIRMRRKRKGEHAAKFNHLDTETFVRLRSQLRRWSIDNAEAIARATPEIPPGFDNRREDNWMPLLAIAEACGGEWKKAAWAAALALEDITDDTSIGVQLLQAIRATFGTRANEPKNKDRIKSEDLLNELVADATAPWATWNNGKPISQRQVARLLKDYETPQGTPIKPRTIRLDDGTKDGTTAKGYLLEWFTDAFERFCTPSSPEASDSSVTSSSSPPREPNSSVTSVTSLNTQDFSQSTSVTPQCNVTDKKDRNFFKNNDVTDVTDKNRAGEPRKEDIPDVTDGNGEDRGLHPHQIRELAAWYNARKAVEKTADPAPYKVLRAASPGERCIGCGSASGAMRIKWHDGNVDVMHPSCANKHLAALAEPPVKIPAQFTGAEMAKSEADDTGDPDGWSFNSDPEGSRS